MRFLTKYKVAWLIGFLVAWLLILLGIFTPSYYLTTLAVGALLIRAQVDEVSDALDEEKAELRRAMRRHPTG